MSATIMRPLTCKRSSFKIIQPVTIVLLSVATCCYGISMETNPLRDFSKLRLEQQNNHPSTILSKENIKNSPKDYYYSKEAATENVGVVFKPSYQDHSSNALDYNNHNRNVNRESESYESNHPIMIPGPPPMPPHMQMQNIPNRPQGNINQPEDDGEMPLPPSFYTSTEDSNKGNSMMDRPPENAPINHNGEEPPMPQDVQFIPAPPSSSFLAEIEYDSATGALMEKGMGGLYDSDSENENPENNENSDYFDNLQNQEHQNDEGRDRKEGSAGENGANRYRNGFGDYGDY